MAVGAIASSVLLGPSLSWAATLNPEIKVGIVQRFGANEADRIILAPLSGDQLTVGFKTGNQPQTLTTRQLTLEVAMQPLAQPVLQEWVVLSTHRSFESAEDSAARWQAAGINAEIAQPDTWQVWAKREDYATPLLRRLLQQNLHAAGYTGVFIDSKVFKEVPKATFTANGYKYTRDQFTITSANRQFQMGQGNTTRYPDLFPGTMKVQPNAYGSYTLVNQVPVDAYLRGVVPHEIGAGAPRTAIEAQAILARTYALRNLRRFAIDNYEICADTQCQVYFGWSETDPVSDSAIAATSGQVLTHENELIDALYSSTAGGITASFTDVWNGDDRPYLRPVIDSLQTRWDLSQKPLSNEANFRAFIALNSGFNEDGWPAFRWNRSASLKEIGDTMKEYLAKQQHPLAGFSQITGLTVTERANSGRVQKLQVDTDIGSFDLVKDEAVKALIPPRSLLFYLEPIMEVPKADGQEGALASVASKAKPEERAITSNPLNAPTSNSSSDPNPNDAAENNPNSANNNNSINEPNSSQTAAPSPIITGYRFIGGGFGHGVGMSQTGAYNLGDKGYSSEQILEFYYPGTELKPISESTIFYQGK
ncbi:MAG: amidase [Phormidesmis priestleyi]|uniref:Amidase n=1 Tax=Phormidesmis priestleyi TaxID=268141 RepID=A0A2W4YMF3_9CYAN|nr:MAG: amidase [Phormidesmis priestleyi]